MRRRRRRGLAVALLLGGASACGTTIDLEPLGPSGDGGADAGVDGTNGEAAPAADADVCARDADGGCLSELLASGLGDVFSIAVRNGFVYFAAFSKGYVGRVGVTGGPPQIVLPDVSEAIAVAVDDTQLVTAVWGVKGNANLVHATLADPIATRTTRDTCPKARDVVITDNGVFGLGRSCADEAKSHLVRLGGTGLETVAKESDGPMGSLVAHAGTLFWTTDTVLHRTSDTLMESTFPVYDLAGRGERFLSVANDAATVYARTSKSVLRLETTPTNAEMTVLATVAPAESIRLGIALSDTAVYYASAARKQIFRVGKTGGPVTSAALDDKGPVAIVLDGPWLYWTNQAGELHRRHL